VRATHRRCVEAKVAEVQVEVRVQARHRIARRSALERLSVWRQRRGCGRGWRPSARALVLLLVLLLVVVVVLLLLVLLLVRR
jgi:Flp pilus assembly protein TadB